MINKTYRRIKEFELPLAELISDQDFLCSGFVKSNDSDGLSTCACNWFPGDPRSEASAKALPIFAVRSKS